MPALRVSPAFATTDARLERARRRRLDHAPQCSSAATPDNTYAVRTFTPPQTDLGIVQLPGVVANGDSVDMHGKAWVVSRISTQFKLQRGRYLKDGQRLYVVETSRWLLNRQLNELLEK